MRMRWRFMVVWLGWPLWWPLAVVFMLLIVAASSASSVGAERTNVTMWNLARGCALACLGAAWRAK